MKNLYLWALLILPMCNYAQKIQSYKLVWKEEFKGRKIDSKTWSKIPRGSSDWNRNMSAADELYQLRNGKLVLKGRSNTDFSRDTAKFITGGVYSKEKKSFEFGRIDVRARLGGATGAWPAIWMLPEGKPWPSGGEIDIMERLNSDSFAYQTIHSSYTQNQQKKIPPNSATGKIDPGGFNTYSVEIFPDSLVFFINNVHTFTYPRIQTDDQGQFPFSENKYYLLLDMQLGGSWVGSVNPAHLPVEMEIDYVRFYQPKTKKMK